MSNDYIDFLEQVQLPLAYDDANKICEWLNFFPDKKHYYYFSVNADGKYNIYPTYWLVDAMSYLINTLNESTVALERLEAMISTKH